ncbi:MAG: hypothetical protein PHY47_21725 [Lachnospiraceae bacterium]|nr:hypothetical protein [Lachnospiraceae bacterium]
MKFKFSLKDKEASLEADVEKLVEKGMDQKAARPERKTRYQIKQEEKRKNEELKQKHFMQGMMLMLGLLVILVIFGIVASVMGI